MSMVLDEHDDALHRRYAAAREPEVADELLRRHSGLAMSLANRFAGRGEPIEELEQVARVGLWLALTRFDPDRGLRFSTFATPTILGELRRHFRDRSWLVKPPRTLQERHLALEAAIDELEGCLARRATVAELAAFTQLSEEAVVEGLAVGLGRRASASLDAPLDDYNDVALHDAVGGEDAGFTSAETELFAASLLEHLSEPARTAISLRYMANASQREIAFRLGVSQMTVARTIGRALERLRMISARPGFGEAGSLAVPYAN
jgi:RNA polymerase sigma-B factor